MRWSAPAAINYVLGGIFAPTFLTDRGVDATTATIAAGVINPATVCSPTTPVFFLNALDTIFVIAIWENGPVGAPGSLIQSRLSVQQVTD